MEIERKFLVQGDDWRSGKSTLYRQGYLSRDKERTVRVRIADKQAFLTIKGISTGASRAEFEYEIPVADAEQLLLLCDGPLIEKTRYLVLHAGMTWEVDEFHGANKGLVVVEIELQSETQIFSKPAWVGMEVTHEKRYFNSSLSAYPYNTWHQE
jgi:CYTH domain-containing protein